MPLCFHREPAHGLEACAPVHALPSFLLAMIMACLESSATCAMSADHTTYFTNGVLISARLVRCCTSKSTICAPSQGSAKAWSCADLGQVGALLHIKEHHLRVQPAPSCHFNGMQGSMPPQTHTVRLVTHSGGFAESSCSDLAHQPYNTWHYPIKPIQATVWLTKAIKAS